MAGQTYKTSDPQVIRRWAAARAGQPAIMPSHEKNATTAAVPHIVFPADAYLNSYTTISWQELFDRMQREALVFVYQEKTASGSLSHFCRFVSPEAAVGVEAEPGTRQAKLSEATGLYQTEDLDSPQARGMQAFRQPHRTTGRSRRLLIGLVVLAVLVIGLIIGVFWPTA
jgi:hypothetical protein